MLNDELLSACEKIYGHIEWCWQAIGLMMLQLWKGTFRDTASQESSNFYTRTCSRRLCRHDV